MVVTCYRLPDSQDYYDFVDAIYRTINYTKANNGKKFIISHITNPGGDMALLDILRTIFWPGQANSFFNFSVPLLLCNSSFHNDLLDMITRSPVHLHFPDASKLELL